MIVKGWVTVLGTDKVPEDIVKLSMVAALVPDKPNATVPEMANSKFPYVRPANEGTIEPVCLYKLPALNTTTEAGAVNPNGLEPSPAI